MAKKKRPTIELCAFWELTEAEQARVREYFATQAPEHQNDFEEYNYNRDYAEEGIIDWVDIKGIYASEAEA